MDCLEIIMIMIINNSDDNNNNSDVCLSVCLSPAVITTIYMDVSWFQLSSRRTSGSVGVGRLAT